MKTPIILAGLTFLATTVLATAQGVTPNPLRQDRTITEKTQPKQKETRLSAASPDAPAATEKPKRERSAKQKQGDEDMRSCGTSWRAEKDNLKAKGETWRTYLKSCRAQLKTARGA